MKSGQSLATARRVTQQAMDVMEFSTDPQDQQFRERIRSLLKEQLTPELARAGRRRYAPKREHLRAWQAQLYAAGLGAGYWSEEDGGAGWNGRQRLIFDEELAALHAPLINVQGITLFGPVLNRYGTEAQKERFRADLLQGEAIWCQGFSEPGAGSDLASLRTTATPCEGGWLINGQKIWTSQANIADWIFLLARTNTNVKKQAGLSFFVADMQSPGIEVRPIISIDGQHHLNEVFIENLFVPTENLIGEQGQGWEIAKFLLNDERIFGSADLPALLGLLDHIREIAAHEHDSAARLIDDEAFWTRYCRLEFEVEMIRMKIANVVSGPDLEDAELAITGSSIKIQATETYMALAELAAWALGDNGPLFVPDPEGNTAQLSAPVPSYAEGITTKYLYSRAASIYGGANEIQRDIIAKARFGW